MTRKRLLTAVAGAVVAAAIGGVAWASIPGSGNVYSACMLKGIGTIRLIDKSLPSTNLMSRCTDKETEVSWNKTGQPGTPGAPGAKGEPGAPGTNGVSVTTASEPEGPNCANGGSRFTAANGVTYACNGAPGASVAGGRQIRAVQLPAGDGATSTPTTMVLYDLPGIGRFTAQCGTNQFHNGNGLYETAPAWEYTNTSGEQRTLFAQSSQVSAVGYLFRPVAPGGTVFSRGGFQGLFDQIQVFSSAELHGALSPATEVTIAGIADENAPFGAPCTFWATAMTP